MNPTLTEPRRQQLDGIVHQMTQNGEPDHAIQFVVSDFKQKYGQSQVTPDSSGTGLSGGFFGKVRDTINEFNPFYQIPKMAIEGGVKAGEGIAKVLTSSTPGEATKGAISALAGGVTGLSAIPFGAFQAITNLPGVKQVKDFLWGTDPNSVSLPNLIGNKISDIKPLQNLVSKYQDSPEVAGDMINIILGLSGVSKLNEPAIRTEIKNTIGTVPPEGTPPGGGTGILGTAANIEAKVFAPKPLNEPAILDKYNRAIRPTVVGKSDATQIAQANTRVISGLRSISDNKTNLSLTDADGNVIKGETPKSVDQLTQAIGQTKSLIFRQYDSLAKQTGEQGITVDVPTIGRELDPIINSKSLAIVNPKAIRYAKSLQERLTAAGTIDTQTSQDVIQHYNDSLTAFYKNPSYDNASKVSIDALIANRFRETLDQKITGATGEKYQALKNQYGALASMEKDVAHRNIVWARQNKVGLVGSLANITSGAELLRGLMRLNPTDIAVSAAIKGMQMYIRYLNNPDVGVEKIFSELERAPVASPPATSNTSGSTKSKPK